MTVAARVKNIGGAGMKISTPYDACGDAIREGDTLKIKGHVPHKIRRIKSKPGCGDKFKMSYTRFDGLQEVFHWNPEKASVCKVID